ncbi:hypothetical protein ABZ092_20615 [Streptomyces bobili]|uniref:hypothetical protein n=1 Tax=Streptomyces bobili TaxID=67280 RepID=UPI0033ADB207
MTEIAAIRGDLELLTRTAHLLSSVREEFVCAARALDTWSRPGARQAMAARAGHTHQVRKLLGIPCGRTGPERLRRRAAGCAEVLVGIQADGWQMWARSGG